MSKNMGFKDSPLGLIPDDWEYTKLSNITNIKRGASPRPIDNPIWFADEGRGWVRINDVTRSNGHLYSTEQYLSPLGVTKSVPVNVGQLIMSICATIGEPAIVEIDVCIHDGFVVFDQYEKYLTTKFLYHFLRFYTPNFQNYGQTGTQANLNTTIVGATPIALPPLKEQEKIAEILDKVDSSIELTEALIKKLKQIKAGLLQDLLTRGLDEKGELRNPDTHPEQFKDSPLGKIPINWEVVELKSLLSSPIKDFGSFSMTNLLDFQDSGIPFLKTEAIYDYGLDIKHITFISEKIHQLLPQSIVYKNDILLTKIVAIGRVCLYDGSLGICNSNAASAKIRISSSLASKDFIAYFLRSDFAKRQYLNSVISTPPRINLNQINQLNIITPPLKEQVKIVKILDTQEKAIEKEEQYLKKLKQKKQGLMQDLLTGKVRVNHLFYN
ncbi:restriction endonuclease subunit S [Geminocystis sp. GBBB08]|uniref:restriction endonuclease subunit S n=1 Tax=Geminocystis sp. GBBB08 TaxID=2604140 RepID=UPI0027E2B820|nr:restriction endonuclease subunit S [Geminocystis sp. GBBB08]MBL1209862.1 hypothetical protein [Geminocystis sp. GBBB08]